MIVHSNSDEGQMNIFELGKVPVIVTVAGWVSAYAVQAYLSVPSWLLQIVASFVVLIGSHFVRRWLQRRFPIDAPTAKPTAPETPKLDE